MVDFPEAILGRAVLREGFAYERNSAIERTEMDSGLARGRLINANPTARVSCAFVWDETQVQFFEAWLQTSARYGAAWFNIYLPLEGNTYRKVLARVVSVQQRKPRAVGLMTVPLELEIHDAVILPDGIVDLVLEFGTSALQQAVADIGTLSLEPFFLAWRFDA